MVCYLASLLPLRWAALKLVADLDGKSFEVSRISPSPSVLLLRPPWNLLRLLLEKSRLSYERKIEVRNQALSL